MRKKLLSRFPRSDQPLRNPLSRSPPPLPPPVESLLSKEILRGASFDAEYAWNGWNTIGAADWNSSLQYREYCYR